jgi:hypothetical protein
LAVELLYFGCNLSNFILILVWWKLKITQFKKTVFVTTFFDHHSLLSLDEELIIAIEHKPSRTK